MEPPKDPATAPPASARAAWLARAVLVLVAVGAVFAGFVLARPPPPVAFSCPMHAEVRAAAPGVCPVCGMALERASAGAALGPAGGEVPPFVVTAGELFAFRPRVFSREVRAPARVAAVSGDGIDIAALLHADELEVAEEQGGLFAFTSHPGLPLPIRRLPKPPEPVDETTSWVLFRIGDGVHVGEAIQPATMPPPGSPGWVSWPARPRSVFVVPDTAIVRGADGPYVLVAAAAAPLGVEKRAVKVGKVFEGLGVIVSGLAPGERVVGDGAFSWDAERRLRAAPAARAQGTP